MIPPIQRALKVPFHQYAIPAPTAIPRIPSKGFGPFFSAMCCLPPMDFCFIDRPSDMQSDCLLTFYESCPARMQVISLTSFAGEK